MTQTMRSVSSSSRAGKASSAPVEEEPVSVQAVALAAMEVVAVAESVLAVSQPEAGVVLPTVVAASRAARSTARSMEAHCSWAARHSSVVWQPAEAPSAAVREAGQLGVASVGPRKALVVLVAALAVPRIVPTTSTSESSIQIREPGHLMAIEWELAAAARLEAAAVHLEQQAVAIISPSAHPDSPVLAVPVATARMAALQEVRAEAQEVLPAVAASSEEAAAVARLVLETAEARSRHLP
jgi:hypothetical protein